MEIFLHIGGENQGPFSEDQVKAKYGSGEAGPDTLAWKDDLDTWYALSSEKFAFLGLASPAPADPEPKDAPEPEAAPEPSSSPEAAASAEETATAQPAADDISTGPAQEPQPEGEAVPAVVEESLSAEGEEEAEPAPDPAELAAASAAYDKANAFEPRSRDVLHAEMVRLKQEHDKVLMPEIGRTAVEQGIRVSGATEILTRIEDLRQKGDQYKLEQAYVSYAHAVVSAGYDEPALAELIQKERLLAEQMLNLHAEAKGLGKAKKPGGALKWILVVVALLALAGVVALIYFNTQ